MADIFISYVSDDKEFAEQVRQLLEARSVQTNDAMLNLGDSLSSRIEQGLRQAQYGILILSPGFFRRPWPRFELDRLATTEREYEGATQLLPVWHQVSQQDIARFSSHLASKVGVPSSAGPEAVVNEIVSVVRPAQKDSQSMPSQMSTQRPMTKVGNIETDLSRLRELLTTYFSDWELRELCFDLDIDFENLAGSGKRAKVQDLILYMQRRGRLNELLEAARAQRPHVDW